MVKERLEEARNSPKGNFYFFLPLLWENFGGLWPLLFSAFLFSLVLLKFQILIYNNHSLSIVLKGQKE
ncbi:hypothetical protein MPG53_06680 [Helicobacter pylori]|uniref:hypothetical protein n=1 Tax=Helicobacter pylori TaxID=210 RepID=UPI001FD25F0B|nr:hypothetical protein [Helicobacter pylori]UOS29824.1 hypothetical protein MPG53_06680 [Helicobacter pylori]